jgi:hypothetical protein
MSIFSVRVETVMVVEADNYFEATKVALDNISENDSWEAEKGEEIQSLDELQGGWDGMCLPFGGDGAKRLKDILPED